jgi:septal ring factor EnvC (AmiA/AmiB activator)
MPKRANCRICKGRIEALRRDMAAAEETKTYAADQLRETESAISTANRRLHELGAERAETRSQLAELDAQGQRLDRQTGAHRTSWHACSTASSSAAIQMP